MKKSSIAIISIISTILSIASCALEPAFETAMIELYVPEYCAVALPGAKALSPYTARVLATITLPDGSIRGPDRYDVVPGQVNRVAIRAPLVAGARLQLVTQDALGNELTRFEGDVDFASGRPVQVALVPSSAPSLGSALSPGSSFSLAEEIPAGGTRFRTVDLGYDGPVFVSGLRFERCWIAAYDPVSGKPLASLASSPSDGWVAFEASEGQSVLLAFAPAPGKVLPAGMNFYVRQVRFLRAGAAGGTGTRAAPIGSLEDPAFAQAAPDMVWMASAGDYPVAATVTFKDGAFIGGLSDDFSSFADGGAKSLVHPHQGAANPLARDGNLSNGLLLQGFRFDGWAPEAEAISHAFIAHQASSTAVVRLRKCEFRAGNLYSGSGSNPTISCGLTIAETDPFTAVDVEGCSIVGPRIQANMRNGVGAALCVASGAVTVEACVVDGGVAEGGYLYGCQLSGIRAEGITGNGMSGSLAILRSRIDAGKAGSTSARGGGIYLRGVSVNAASLTAPLAIAGSAIHAGSARVGENSTTVDLAAISLASTGDTYTCYLSGNLVSGGLVDVLSMMPQNEARTAGILNSRAIYGYVVGNSIDSGAILFGTPSGFSRSVCYSFTYDANGPDFSLNSLFASRNSDCALRGIEYFDPGRLALAQVMANAFLGQGLVAARAGATEYATPADLDAIQDGAQNSVPDGNFAALSSWFPSLGTAYETAAGLASGVLKPSAAAAASLTREAGFDMPIRFKIDATGRDRSGAVFWTVGAYQL